jgi:C_GCAxxG_C_C family probable redox protein
MKFAEGYNCAQSVFHAFHEELQVEADMALKLACAFGAGMGRNGEVCGAVTGGLLVLGARYGRGEQEDRTVTDAVYARTRDFMNRFAQRHGSCLCRQLLNGCDLTTEAGRTAFAQGDLVNKVCKPCVRSAVELLEQEL